MFHGQEFPITDETYTFAQDSFSRTNVHVLTSIDYDKMSAADKAAESKPRTDRTTPSATFAAKVRDVCFTKPTAMPRTFMRMTPMLEHIRAGIQYALGDLKADDSPSRKPQ